MTGFEALRLTRGTWGRVERGLTRCPVCKEPVSWPDHSRAAHLRVHLRTGWRPGVEAPAPRTREAAA